MILVVLLIIIRTPRGMYFYYNSGYVEFGKWETNRTIYNSYIEDIKLNNFEDLSCWIKQWIADTTITDLNDRQARKDKMK